ncbi:peptide synthetase [Aeromonas schubertii]|uniref:AMP-binding protein n=1 Tax=Aeromonas schubertii TaxID=652 RepID=UPI00067EFF5C|nr:AMP-binding protein [Aeromonas schubertii]KUE79945.1 peptide synthetase [Aeromonas schubertii]
MSAVSGAQASADLAGSLRARLAANPDAPAITMGGQTLSYGALIERVGQIAGLLEGLAVGERVGLYLTRSPDLVASLLACLRLGLTFVPLDPAFPAARLETIARRARLSALLCDGEGGPDVGLPRLALSGAGLGSADHWPRVDDGVAAYMMFTSGSTGEPKGVVISRRALHRFLSAIAERLGLTPECHWLFITTSAFDISLLEMLGPLWGGGRLTVASGEEHKDPTKILALLEGDASLNWLQATPASWRMLLKAGWQGTENLTALCGGEALDPGLAAELCRRTRRLWHCYGPTEATVWSMVGEVTSAAGEVTLTNSLSGYRHWVIDESGAAIERGEGELCIESEALFDGYWERPDLGEAAQLTHAGRRLYRTGDRVRRLGADRFLYLGRRDDQVKLRGFRIELGEVEAALRRQSGVQEAAVRLWGEGDEAMLVGYVEAKAGVSLSRPALRRGLQAILPYYMVPARLMLLPTLPKGGSGKIDRKALPLP